MSDYTQCPKCHNPHLTDSLPRQICLDCDWREEAELTRLRAQQTVLVDALKGAPFPGGGGGPNDLYCPSVFANAISCLHVEGHHTMAHELQSVMKSQSKALATLDVPEEL